MDINMIKQDDFRAELAASPAFTAKMALDFAMLVSRQAESVYQSMGISFPVTASSTVLYLTQVKAASLAEIARTLGHPHQLIAQRLKTLRKLELIESKPDLSDRRRTAYILTKKGKSQGNRLQKYCSEADRIFCDLSDEIGVDLLSALRNAHATLQDLPLSRRFKSDMNNESAQ
jgi:DNA-binding MarR family transcriptional regulator